MNTIVNKLLLAGHKFLWEVYIKQPGFTYNACGPFTKHEGKYKQLKKQEIQDVFIKTNLIKFVLNMIWLMEFLKI